MFRILCCLCVGVLVGCSGTTVSSTPTPTPKKNAKSLEKKNAERKQAQDYLVALSEVQTLSDEKKILTEFGQWLTKRGYKIRVEIQQGKHMLSCPYFPPVTPWTHHTFLDIQNLELLPQTKK